MRILECARRVASAGNLQRLRYATIVGDDACRAFFAVSLGGLLPEDKKPTADVAPTAYIVISAYESEPDQNLLIDVGISAETVCLAARELGIGSCMIRNFKKEYFSKLVADERLFPILVIALGYPKEEAQIVDVGAGESLKYYKNENDVNIVPKLELSQLVIKKQK